MSEYVPNFQNNLCYWFCEGQKDLCVSFLETTIQLFYFVLGKIDWVPTISQFWFPNLFKILQFLVFQLQWWIKGHYLQPFVVTKFSKYHLLWDSSHQLFFVSIPNFVKVCKKCLASQVLAILTLFIISYDNFPKLVILRKLLCRKHVKFW
jgi:hypothetical protein